MKRFAQAFLLVLIFAALGAAQGSASVTSAVQPVVGVPGSATVTAGMGTGAAVSFTISGDGPPAKNLKINGTIGPQTLKELDIAWSPGMSLTYNWSWTPTPGTVNTAIIAISQGTTPGALITVTVTAQVNGVTQGTPATGTF